MGKKLNSNIVDSILGGVSNNAENKPITEPQKTDIIVDSPIVDPQTFPVVYSSDEEYVTMRIPKRLHREMKKRALYGDVKVGKLYENVIELYLQNNE